MTTGGRSSPSPSRSGSVVGKQTPISLGKFIAKYFELHESGNRPSTGKRDVYVLRRLLDFVGDIHLTRISREMLERYKAHRQQAVKPATINLELRVTKSLFNRAREWGYLKRVPTEGLKMLRVDQKENFLLQLVPARKNPGDPLHSPLFG